MSQVANLAGIAMLAKPKKDRVAESRPLNAVQIAYCFVAYGASQRDRSFALDRLTSAFIRAHYTADDRPRRLSGRQRT